ncbi:MAG: peptide ABC transporter substrate-binding protein [Geminicoccaceae bacterium]
MQPKPTRHLRTRCLALAGVALASFLSIASASAEMVYRVATMGEPKTLDPHGVSGTWENIIVGDQFMGLLTDDAAAHPIPGAAESWTVSDDGLVYTFKLRDHKWSDGQPVTADDFVFSFQRILDPALAAEYASLLYPIKNAEAINSGKITDKTQLGVKALDSKTLEITLEGPTGYFLELLTHYTAFPVPKHVVEKLGTDWIKPGNFVSNGPYKVIEWTPHAQVVAVKNPEFYDAANVKIDKVIYYPDEDRNAVTKRFRAGEIDFQDDFASEQIDFLRKELPAETRIAPYIGTYYYVTNFNRKPFDDERVRKALSMAIERDAITDKVLKTGEVPAYGVVPPGTGGEWVGYEPDWKALPYAERVAMAKALLADAGYGPDNPLKVELAYNTSENHKRIAVAIQSMWKALGVQAELVNREVKVHYDTLKQNDFDVARAAWVADYNDPQNFLYLLETRTGVQNYGRYSNPEFDKLMTDQGLTKDQAARMAMMKDAEEIAMGQNAWLPIYYYVSKALVSQKLEGYVDNAKHTHRARWMSIKEG